MNPAVMMTLAAGLGVLATLPRPAPAQTPIPTRMQTPMQTPAAPPEPPTEDSRRDQGLERLQLQVGHYRLSAGYAPWREAGVRGDYRLQDHLWSAELMHADRFGEKGTFVGLQDRVRLSANWAASLHYGIGEGAAWLPRDRVDGFVHHSWGEQNNWVTHLGAGYYRSNNAYRDRWASLGLSAYLEPYLQSPWVLQAEMRWSQSHPGSVDTRQQFLALSWGRHGQTVLTGRHGWGREGWQLLGDARSIVDFASRQDTLTVQHWLTPQWGLKLVADHYRNDSYRRRGLNLAVFREWP